MWVAAAGLTWMWEAEDAKDARPDLAGPFETEQAAVDWLRVTFPGSAPDEYPSLVQEVQPVNSFRTELL